MKKAIFLICVTAVGCATTAVPTQQPGALLKDNHQFYCDWSDPKVGFSMHADVENGVLVRERVDLDGDGVMDRTVEYQPVDDMQTNILSDGQKIGEIRRTENQIVSEWEDPPQRVVMSLDDAGRLVRIYVKRTTSAVEGEEPPVDSVKTLVYDGDRVIQEITKHSDLVETVETHEYDQDGRRSKTISVTSGVLAVTETSTYTYVDGRCLRTVN